MSSAPENPSPRIGIVTVVYRSNDVLPALLDSLADAVGEPFSLAIADNLPGEGSSAEKLAQENGGVYLPLESNPGYGAAINVAVEALPASVSWIVVSNPDVVYRPGSIAELVSVAAADDSIGATGPAVENIDGSLYPSARSVPSLRTGIGHALFGLVWANNPWTIAYVDGRASTGEQRDVGWLSGSCFVISRSAFESVEGFDERYFMYFEDVDLGYRLGKAGFRSVYVPTARALHTGAHSTDGDSARMVRAHHDSAKRFLATKYQGWYLAPLRAILSLGLDARAAITVQRISRLHQARPQRRAPDPR